MALDCGSNLALLDAIFTSAPLGLAFIDRDLRYVRVNQLLADMNGTSQEAHVGRRPRDLLPDISLDACEETWRRILATGEAELGLELSGETAAVPGKRRQWVSDYHRVELDGERIGIVAMVRDVTAEREATEVLSQNEERERLVHALRESERRFARLAESGIIGIAITGLDGEVVEANDAYLAMLGYTRDDVSAGVIRWRDDPNSTETDGGALEQLMGRGVAAAFEKPKRRKDGTIMPALVAVAMLDAERCITVVADLSARKNAEEALRHSEEQLRQAQKMEAIGRLAGGVAHDFNNLLCVIMSYCELIAGEVEGAVRADLEQIAQAGRRACELTRQLLAFSRQQVLQPQLVDLGEVVDGLEKMLRRLLGEDIELSIICDAEPCTIYVDPGQIEQVVMNLAVNARDAMPEGGELTIRSGRIGSQVMLSVRDNGCGMDAATQARVFEPFFTTKEAGKGTGLGLSTVFGIVQQSGGTIAISSQPRAGATFTVLLPPADPGLTLPVAAPPSIESDQTRGTETILLVEDESEVRVVATRILRRSGYTVLEASGAGDALLQWELHGKEVDLLLTDVVMPKMTGRQLADRLHALRPEVPVLYMSGYTDDAMLRQRALGSELAFLPKPFSPEALTRKVREVLGRKRSEASLAAPAPSPSAAPGRSSIPAA
jgi:two-component system cell cycle sensor histidine kinase/response regulator CckA